MIRFRDVEIDRSTQTIRHGLVWHRFLKNHSEPDNCNLRFKLISHLLLSTGLNSQQLFALLYDRREDGGPLYGENIIKIMTTHALPIINKLNFKLCTRRHLSRSVYWLVLK